jgi:hypothetical protein
MDDGVLRDFALDSAGVSLLISLQLKLITEDIAETQKTSWRGDNQRDLKGRKSDWKYRWRGLVENGFRQSERSDAPSFLPASQIRPALERFRKNRIQAGLVLLEMVAFTPYFPFGKEDVKAVKGLSVDKQLKDRALSELSSALGFDAAYAEKLRKSIKSTTLSMTGYWWKTSIVAISGIALGAATMGLAAPFIAGLVGAGMGLHGAAALTAGLAAIGGGAVAAGGFGVAGGMTVLIGGGVILGLGTGATTGHYLASMTSAGTLLSAVKLEVALKEIILQGQYDQGKAQEILTRQRTVIDGLEKEVDRLRTGGKEEAKRIKELERAVEVLRKALKRNQDIVRGAA